ncbi:MAG: TIGR03084 family metal-binding protein [Pseudomonadales bacterium]
MTPPTQIDDLRAEADELNDLLLRLDAADWSRVTAFKSWTVYDVVAHLHLSDHMGLTALEGETPFRALLRRISAGPGSMAQFAREWLGAVSGPALRERWHESIHRLCDGLAAADPETRLPWAGPGMKPRMFATARQMETWAHGWELYDLLGLPRAQHERLRNVATIGVRTFGWTFTNRGLPVPESVPYVELSAPGGGLWRWNDPQSPDRVCGDAVDFCQVVTQVRHVQDTGLRVEGATAGRWMAMAQCFAGPPHDPPPPGSRVPLGGRPPPR